MRFFVCGREDGCFAAPAASRCCACGRKQVLRLRAQAGVAPAGAGWGVSCSGTSNFLFL